jgi:hypothetical protein
MNFVREIAKIFSKIFYLKDLVPEKNSLRCNQKTPLGSTAKVSYPKILEGGVGCLRNRPLVLPSPNETISKETIQLVQKFQLANRTTHSSSQKSNPQKC